jgi:hypothetical protein
MSIKMDGWMDGGGIDRVFMTHWLVWRLSMSIVCVASVSAQRFSHPPFD